MTLLSACQQVANEIGVFVPSTIIGNSEETARRLLAMARREAKELMDAGPWTILDRVTTITTVADQAEYDLPSDYSRMISDTMWDATNHWPTRGPVTPQEWQALKNSFLGSGIVWNRYRIRRASTAPSKRVYIDPTPTTAGDSLVYEYISNAPIVAVDGTTTKTDFTADDDSLLLPESVFELGIKWRMIRAIGQQPYATEVAEYERMVAAELARDRTTSALSLVPRRRRFPMFIGPWSVPDTGYGS